jgi:protein SCO1/2
VNVTTRRDHCWVGRYIAEPDKMLAEKDPVAVELFAKYKNVRMPNLSVEPADVAILVSYIEEQGRAAPQPSLKASVSAR